MSHEAGDSVVGRAVAGLRQAEAETVYLGTALVIAGSVLAVIGWALFAVSEGQPRGSGTFWAYRQAAVVAGGVAVVALLGGGVRLATAVGPVRRSVVGAATAGVLLCFAALSLFVIVYPVAWNAPGVDYAFEGVTTYALGVGCLSTAFARAVWDRYPS